MRNYSTGKLLFRLVCLVVLSSVESFNWTAQPTNPTPAIKGQDVSLVWQYSLNADELLQSQSQYFIVWKKLNQSTSIYDQIGAINFVKIIGALSYQEPRSPHIVIDRSDQATLRIKDVRKDDEGTYKIEFVLESDGTVVAEQRVNLTILEQTEFDFASDDQDVCEDSMVTLYCNATGKPAPSINWKRVWENGTDSEQLPVVDGSYVMSNIKRSSSGTYRCTAHNGVGDPVNRTVKVIVGYSASVVRIVKSSNIVIEGDTFNLTCNVSGDPRPNVTWITMGNDEHSYGHILNFTNITRDDSGDYRCVTKNKCGQESRDESINVFYRPDLVTLVTNTTENEDCSDLWVNFTCISSEANPPVYKYLLSDDEGGFSFSESGTWIKKISRGGKPTYNCSAYQLVENVTSARNITMTVNGPLAMEQAENKTVQEGYNVKVYCNVTGFPDPTVIWSKVQGGGYNPTEAKPHVLSITNITRAQAGEYSCSANNTCGETSTVMNINVQYKPENVILTTNTTSKVCTGVIINFICTAEANPPVHTYLLYENDTMIKNMGISGILIKTMENAGQFVFRCEASNSIQGIGKSGTTTLTVDVPASVEKAENKIITEGGNMEVYCKVTGIPYPTVMWTNNKTGEHIKENPLNITNINRTQAGEYKCTANNTCGEASTVININVQYPPDIVNISRNQTANESDTVDPTCTVDANPKASITWTRVSDNSSVPFPMNITGKQDEGGYRCTADNGVGNPDRKTVYITVENYRPIETVLNAHDNTVNQNETFNITCRAQAKPAAKYRFYKNQVNVYNDTSDKDVGVFPTSVNERVLKMNYSCTPFNKFGDGPMDVIAVSVLFPPSVIDGNHTEFVSQENCPASISCPVLGNPEPNVTWYDGTDTSTIISNASKLELSKTVCNHGGPYIYTCFAENHLGNVTSTRNVLVEYPAPITSSIPTTRGLERIIYAKATIIIGCDKRFDVEEKFPKLACERARDLGCLIAEPLSSRCGSVIVDFEMKFNQSAVVSEVLNVLKTAAKEDKFDGFKVDPNSIEQISPPTTGTSSTKKPVCSGFFKKEDCNINLVAVIIIAVVGLVVICIIVSIIACWVHKRRKCRKDTRVHHSTSEERPFSRENSTPGDDNSYSKVNNGYAEAGPRPSEMTDMVKHKGASGPAAIPDYAVVDKSAKKGKKKDKKVEEQKAQAEPAQYAAVDKSKKKKKKEEPEATYAQVDMSKKSKKKPKPGEVLYADLGDFHQMQELPKVSTSPQALPPIKKPVPYAETQYADITQFLKGDATLPDSNNSQEPDGSTKETSKAGNTGGDGGPGHETNF